MLDMQRQHNQSALMRAYLAWRRRIYVPTSGRQPEEAPLQIYSYRLHQAVSHRVGPGPGQEERPPDQPGTEPPAP